VGAIFRMDSGRLFSLIRCSLFKTYICTKKLRRKHWSMACTDDDLGKCVQDPIGCLCLLSCALILAGLGAVGYQVLIIGGNI
jgi:hypothetical protein